MSRGRIVMLLHKSVEHDSRVRREASTLAEAGLEVIVLELAPVPAGAEQLDGFRRVSALPPGRLSRLPARARQALGVVWFVVRTVRSRPDVVHAHDAAMLVPALVAARIARVPFVYDSHELATAVPYREREWAALVGAIERICVPRAAAVITVSAGIAERLKERYRMRRAPVVLRNVSALSARAQRSQLRERLGLQHAPVVLHQGAAAPGRGCLTLVRALALLPGVHLVFLGSGMGSFDAEVARLAAELGEADRVHVLPSVPLEELLSATAEADVGVTLLEDTCENHRLALPNKLFDYVAAGIPVVASDLPEVRGIVERYDLGWLVDPGDPRSIAAGLEKALAEPPVGFAEGSERARGELRWDRESARLTDLYAELLPSAGEPL